jgi:hypothetical protein
MKRWFLPLIALLMLALLGGCAGKKEIREWNASVDVQGNAATVTVDVPGATINRDYHVHVRLDDGPEIMVYHKTYTLPNLKPGKHTIVVGLEGVEHKPLPVEKKTLGFEVK